jgi:hypothetical protein
MTVSLPARRRGFLVALHNPRPGSLASDANAGAALRREHPRR